MLEKCRLFGGGWVDPFLGKLPSRSCGLRSVITQALQALSPKDTYCRPTTLLSAKGVGGSDLDLGGPTLRLSWEKDNQTLRRAPYKGFG